MSETPQSDEFIAEHWPTFCKEVEQRLHQGKHEYGDSSFSKSPIELISEIRQELRDTAAWSGLMDYRLAKLLKKVEGL